jgi:hypothetical protein
MNRRIKLALLVGGVLALLFCCSGVAGRAPQGPFRLRLDLQAPAAAWLRGLLTEKLRARDLRLRGGAEAGCAIRGDRLLVPAGAVCEFAIPTSSRRTRQLALGLFSGSTAAVQLDQELDGQKPMVIAETLKPGGERLTLDVYRSQEKREAQLTLQGCSLDQAAPEQEGQPAQCAVKIGE